MTTAEEQEYNAILAEKREIEKFNVWRRKVNKRIPALAQRIFALRDKHYMGCGFHYGMEASLGSVIKELNTHDRTYYGKDAIGSRIVLEVIVEGLFADVKKAEQSAKSFYSKGEDT